MDSDFLNFEKENNVINCGHLTAVIMTHQDGYCLHEIELAQVAKPEQEVQLIENDEIMAFGQISLFATNFIVRFLQSLR